MEASIQERNLNQLVADRCAFFANRVDVYARILKLDNKEVVEHLQLQAKIYGERKITAIIDIHMPPQLHSSQMPKI